MLITLLEKTYVDSSFVKKKSFKNVYLGVDSPPLLIFFEGFPNVIEKHLGYHCTTYDAVQKSGIDLKLFRREIVFMLGP